MKGVPSLDKTSESFTICPEFREVLVQYLIKGQLQKQGREAALSCVEDVLKNYSRIGSDEEAHIRECQHSRSYKEIVSLIQQYESLTADWNLAQCADRLVEPDQLLGVIKVVRILKRFLRVGKISNVGDELLAAIVKNENITIAKVEEIEDALLVQSTLLERENYRAQLEEVLKII